MGFVPKKTIVSIYSFVLGNILIYPSFTGFFYPSSCYQFILLIVVPAASMWTKKELDEFKESIRNEGGDSIIKVLSIDFYHISSI